MMHQMQDNVSGGWLSGSDGGPQRSSYRSLRDFFGFWSSTRSEDSRPKRS